MNTTRQEIVDKKDNNQMNNLKKLMPTLMNLNNHEQNEAVHKEHTKDMLAQIRKITQSMHQSNQKQCIELMRALDVLFALEKETSATQRSTLLDVIQTLQNIQTQFVLSGTDDILWRFYIATVIRWMCYLLMDCKRTTAVTASKHNKQLVKDGVKTMKSATKGCTKEQKSDKTRGVSRRKSKNKQSKNKRRVLRVVDKAQRKQKKKNHQTQTRKAHIHSPPLRTIHLHYDWAHVVGRRRMSYVDPLRRGIAVGDKIIKTEALPERSCHK
eukprot:786290_1